MQKIITGLFLLVMTFSAYSNEKVPACLNSYVTNLVNEASSILNDSKLSERVKIAQARELMSQNLDFDWMAKYTLGRNGIKLYQVGRFRNSSKFTLNMLLNLILI